MIFFYICYMKKYNDVAIKLRDQNDKKAIQILYKAYYEKLKTFIKRNFKDIPDKHFHDIATTSIIRSFEKIDQFDETKASYKTWLFTIAYNNCRLYFLKDIEHTKELLIDNDSFELLGLNRSITGNLNKTFVKSCSLYDEDKHPLDRSDDAFNYTDDELDNRINIVKDIMRSLKESDRILITDYLINDLTIQQIFDKYDYPMGTVKSKIRMIKNKIIKKYNSIYPGEINIALNEKILSKKRDEKKERDEKLSCLLSTLDIHKELKGIDSSDIHKKVFIEYKLNKSNRKDVQLSFNLKNIDDVNAYCRIITTKLLKKFENNFSD